ncbi:DUF3099 domain-containing protein [Williamsia deligens]|uniref:DUF3099 domain-containing protein n=1 Tax=Williamsia deligens TaxID=321325 RepID=A0ABW3GBI5_9NOCA|nr:DUF3099 domain-containing protein [Williamsia deligens]MCP2195407.1 Protein of unknown function (DUF3099) [Williamsia deligens]
MAHEEAREAILITQAQPSQEDQQRARVRRYLTLMAFRVPALVLAGIVYGATGSGLLALAVIALSIPLPWVAVLIANDRPPREKGEVRQYKWSGEHTAPAIAATHHRELGEGDYRMYDHDR